MSCVAPLCPAWAGRVSACTGEVGGVWRGHKAGSADPCGLEGQRGQGSSRYRLAGEACCSLCHQWASKVGDQTFQNRVKLLQLKGEAAHPNFSISGKKGIALVQQYLPVSFLCWSGINRESSGCSFCKLYCIPGPTPFPCEAWRWMADMSTLRHGASSKRQGVSAAQGLDSRLRKVGPVAWGSELILTPGDAMPPCPRRPRLELDRRHCEQSCQRT